MEAFQFLKTKPMTAEPTLGRTMMLDKGLGLNAVDDLIATAGEDISFAKFGWGTTATMDRELILAKTHKYNAAGIMPYPGGTLLEIAAATGQYDEFLAEADALGFKGIEVSDGSTQIDHQKRQQLITQARDAGFFVISEVGKKNPKLDHELTTRERMTTIAADLAAGSNYVIIEAREAGKNIGIYDAQGQIVDDELAAITTHGIDHLIFEAPLKAQQVALILKFGPQVNLGNIASDEVTALATLRYGLRGDTVGRV
ncbi:phosphosulfolactate synthase [Loigolactobacillus bifermentans]|jgi:phosphosulfolactate synthase|uniref:Phosphosulfolactate synthase n=1 Tax=Loigolactobacillus bifermentans DSM 20003 TaxID=1423726 RepID=A0A0R1GJI7_9LACO|nr:phosphosulfolactate synthase [Loigolactobacillus bifermentans]KRK32611.1 phosphosulfolactate synthase [Loigolactobacillus bifermentans DSM 20003]QGG60278.1 phosphosulfolactate synthase [Loigolactobacillus bifermentans]